MPYSSSQKAEIKSIILNKVMSELNMTITDDQFDALIKKYDISFEEPIIPVNTKKMKILVFGALNGKLNDYYLAAKKMGIGANNLEFVSDYSKLTNFNLKTLEDSTVYSDIIFGPNPHKQVNIGDYNSGLSMIKANKNRFPNLIEAKANEKLKISITAFRAALEQTRFYKKLLDNTL